MSLTVVRETFEQRYEKYLKDYEKSLCYMQARLKYMPKEELAYLLAEHDKFERIGCAEYAADDDPGYVMKTYSSNGEYSEVTHEGQERLLDPLGRKVDPWGRPV